MKRILFICLSAGISLIAPASSHATNGHQLSAIGAYQQGMGGAVTAAPYDASTAISNPAGMAMIGSRTDFSFEGFVPTREIEFTNGDKVESGSDSYMVPAIGWTAPMTESHEAYFGGGMYGVSGMGVDYEPITDASFGSTTYIYSNYQFWKMAPTMAWKWGGFALGISLNLDYQSISMKISDGSSNLDLSETQGAYGVGGAIGIIYQPVQAFGVGLSYTSKQNFSEFEWRLAAGDINMGGITNQDGIYTMDLDFPQQAAFGIAVRPFRTVLWTADVKWINYNDTYDKVFIKGDFGTVEKMEMDFGWDDVMVYASALQFDITPNFVFRLGYNHSTSPITRENIDNNLAFPAIVQDHASGGFTIRFGRNWEMTLAYMKALKEEIISPNTGATISLEEQAGDIELSYRF